MAIACRLVTGVSTLVWGADYPHAEGTFPASRRIIDELFAGLNVSDDVRRSVLGLNAARLFGVQPQVHTS